MTPATLAEAGALLYGPQWQRALARDIGVSERTMRRYAAGDTPVPVEHVDNIRALLHDRATAIMQWRGA